MNTETPYILKTLGSITKTDLYVHHGMQEINKIDFIPSVRHNLLIPPGVIAITSPLQCMAKSFPEYLITHGIPITNHIHKEIESVKTTSI